MQQLWRRLQAFPKFMSLGDRLLTSAAEMEISCGRQSVNTGVYVCAQAAGHEAASSSMSVGRFSSGWPSSQAALVSARRPFSFLQRASCQPGSNTSAAGLVQGRGFATHFANHKPMPKFQGGKIKLRTAYKERFKAMADGTIRMRHPGFRHRRFRKTPAQRRRLRGEITIHAAYTNTLKRMGFKMRGG